MTEAKRGHRPIPGCERRFTAEELNILERYFACSGPDDIVLAAQRYDALAGSGDEDLPTDDIVRNLAISSEEFIDFANLKKPLTLRKPLKKNGPAKEHLDLRLVSDLVSEERRKGQTKRQAIETLIDKGAIQTRRKASSIEKDLEVWARQQRETEKAFADIPTT